MILALSKMFISGLGATILIRKLMGLFSLTQSFLYIGLFGPQMRNTLSITKVSSQQVQSVFGL